MHPRVVEVTDRLIQRSRATRQRYLEMIRTAASEGPQRGKLPTSYCDIARHRRQLT